MSKKNPEELLGEAHDLVVSERKEISMSEVLVKKHKRKIQKIIKKFSEPLDDGFQIRDIGSLLAALLELVHYAESLSSLNGEKRRELVVGAVMLAYKEHGKNLPWYAKIIPNKWIKNGAESAVDAMVGYLKTKGIM